MTIGIFTVKKECLKIKVYSCTELFHRDLPCFASCCKIRTESSEFKRSIHLHSLFLQDEAANSLSVLWKYCVYAAWCGNTTRAFPLIFQPERMSNHTSIQ